jgi:hypothetical protein
VPLRIRVPSPGWRLEGRAWLESPVLHWEESQIECLRTSATAEITADLRGVCI